MLDQAENLRQLRLAAPVSAPTVVPGSPMVLVTAGRAGVGTTTVAVNLAAVLADAGKRVLLVDAASERCNLAAVAGVAASQINRSLADVVAGRSSAAEAMISAPAGMSLLSICRGVSPKRGSDSRRDSSTRDGDYSRQSQQQLFAELTKLASDFDLLVVDSGSGLCAWTRRLWLQAQLVMVVTTADGSALLDSYATIKRSVADGSGPAVRLVVNRCDDDRAAADAHRRLSASCQRFLGRAVPAVPALPRHVDHAGAELPPRVWEAPTTAFGQAMLWLGRGVGDVLSSGTADLQAKVA